MPGGDRTGPMGQGPMTGGGFGFCGGGLGFGRGRGGRGLNLRRRLWRGFPPYAAAPFYPQVAYYPEGKEAELLRQEAQHLETSLEEIKKRLSELEKQDSKKEEK